MYCWEGLSAWAGLCLPLPLCDKHLKDICEVNSEGSFQPAYSTNIQFEEKLAHRQSPWLWYDFIMALPSSLQTLSLVSALQIPDSSHIYRLHELLRTPEGAGTDSRGYAPCLAMAKASHGLTLNCFSNLSKSLNKDQSTSPASTVAVLWFTSNLPLQEQARKGKGNSSFLDTGQSVQISL